MVVAGFCLIAAGLLPGRWAQVSLMLSGALLVAEGTGAARRIWPNPTPTPPRRVVGQHPAPRHTVPPRSTTPPPPPTWGPDPGAVR